MPGQNTGAAAANGTWARNGSMDPMDSIVGQPRATPKNHGCHCSFEARAGQAVKFQVMS